MQVSLQPYIENLWRFVEQISFSDPVVRIRSVVHTYLTRAQEEAPILLEPLEDPDWDRCDPDVCPMTNEGPLSAKPAFPSSVHLPTDLSCVSEAMLRRILGGHSNQDMMQICANDSVFLHQAAYQMHKKCVELDAYISELFFQNHNEYPSKITYSLEKLEGQTREVEGMPNPRNFCVESYYKGEITKESGEIIPFFAYVSYNEREPNTTHKTVFFNPSENQIHEIL